jgi:hypothetical protein
LTKQINTGTSTNGPITAAKAAPELIPKAAITTAIASSKLLLAAVNDKEIRLFFLRHRIKLLSLVGHQ